MDWLHILGWIVLVVFLIGGWWVVLLKVPPLPSRKQELDSAFALADIKSGEKVFDLGAGDGRVMILARDSYGAKVSGWELNPLVWFIGKMRLGKDADIRLENLWRADVYQADVVFAFLMKNLMGRFEKEIWAKMRPGARLVSNSFPMPGVKPDRVDEGVFLYIKK